MLAALKYLLILGAIFKCGYGQVIAPGTGPFVGGVGGGGGGLGYLVFFLIPLIFLLLALLQSQVEDALDNSCTALFEDVEISATQTSAIENCEECADHGDDEEECNADSNCDFEEDTCFVSGDFTASATCCSYIFTGTVAEECQTCTGFTTQATCTADTECGWIAATSRCFGEV